MDAKQMKPQNFIIPLVIYPFDVLVSIDETDEQLKKELKKYNITEEDYKWIMDFQDMETAKACRFKNGQTLIRLFTAKRAGDFKALIVHEAFHVTTLVLDTMGFKLKIGSSDEAYAYLLQYIVEQIFKRLKK